MTKLKSLIQNLPKERLEQLPTEILSKIPLELEKEKYEDDPIAFAKRFLPLYVQLPTPDFHRQSVDAIQKAVKSGSNYVEASPRGSGKSTRMEIFVLHTICYRRANFIVFVSNTYDVAVERLAVIKNELESNEELIKYFGPFKTEKWAEDDFETKTKTKVIAKGAEAQIRGLKFLNNRPDIIILDDIENRESVKKKLLRDKLNFWLDYDCLPALAPTGTILFNGTVLGEDCLLKRVMKDGTKYPTWRKQMFKALDEKDTSIWPEWRTTEDLRKLRTDDPRLFSQEYQNEPVSGETVFRPKESWYYQTLPEGCDFYMTADLACSDKDYSDYTVILVCATDWQGKIYVIEYSRGKTPEPSMIIDELFRLYKKYKPLSVGIEKNGFQRWLISNLRQEMTKRNTWMPIKPLLGDRDKFRRITQLQPRLDNGGLFYKSYHHELEEELILFGRQGTDDIVDALAYQLQLALPAQQPEEMRKKKYDPLGDDDLYQPDTQESKTGYYL